MAAPTAPVELVRTELPFPSFVYNLVMAGVAQTVTVPPGVSWMMLAVDDITWINKTGPAAAPSGPIVDGTGSWPVLPRDEIAARRFFIRGLVSFSIFGAAANVAIAFFRDHGDGVLA
jgi:hypothetical protein